MTKARTPIISLTKASVEFSVLTPQGRSIRNDILRTATGGRFNVDNTGHRSVKALDSISLTINKGERVCLLGRNGAGKSTLLRLLSGIYEPTAGTVQINGHPTTLMDLSLGINPEATGFQNVFLRAGLMGLSRKETKAHLDEILDFSELGDYMYMPVRTYSSGMQLRLAFAVSMIARPDILILDEWLSVGDESFQVKAEKKLKQLVSEASVLVIATHSPELVEKVGTRAIVMDRGSVAADGDATEIARQYFRARE